MERVGNQLDPASNQACELFSNEVRNVHGAIVHTYQIVAFGATQIDSAEEAAEIWKQMVELCENAIKSLRNLKDLYPKCGAPELYDLALDYRKEADERYQQNLQDAKCQKIPVPKGLFPKLN